MGSSSPAWLAKDPAAQKHLGKYKEDPQGLVWYVYALDTSRKGDVTRLRRVGRVNVRRSVPLKKLERDYKDVAEDKQTSPDGEVCRDVELQATVFKYGWLGNEVAHEVYKSVKGGGNDD